MTFNLFVHYEHSTAHVLLFVSFYLFYFFIKLASKEPITTKKKTDVDVGDWFLDTPYS